MKETTAFRHRHRIANQLRRRRVSLQLPPQDAGSRHSVSQPRLRRQLGDEKCRRPQIGGRLARPPVRGRGPQRGVTGGFRLHFLRRVFRPVGQFPGGAGDAGRCGVRLQPQLDAPLQLLPVALAVLGGGGLVVAGNNLVSIVGDASIQRLPGCHAHQAVAALHPMVQKGERQSRFVAFNPQSDFAQIHGQRVPVHGVDAVADDGAHCGVVGGRRRFILPGAQLRHPPRQPPGGRQQEMAGAGRRVADLNLQQRIRLRLARFAAGHGNSFRHHRLQRAVHQMPHQLRRGVVGTGLFALRTGGKVKLQPGRQRNLGLKIQQAFINRAELLHINAGIIHPPPDTLPDALPDARPDILPAAPAPFLPASAPSGGIVPLIPKGG